MARRMVSKQVRMSKELAGRLERAAIRLGVSQSAVARACLETALREAEERDQADARRRASKGSRPDA